MVTRTPRKGSQKRELINEMHNFSVRVLKNSNDAHPQEISAAVEVAKMLLGLKDSDYPTSSNTSIGE